MIFTNSRTINKKHNSNIKNATYVIPHTPVPRKVEQPKQMTGTTTKDNKIRMWGPYIWFMLHTMAEKIKKDSFKIVRSDMLEHIYNICSNLPCPSCSTHAKEYLKKIDMNKINTKEELKMMLMIFHNSVNLRLNKPEFTLQQLNDKYKTANFNHIISSFFVFFEDKHKTVNMLSNDMYTMRISLNIKRWLKDNIHHFE